VIHCAIITAGSAREKSDPETIVAVNIQGAVTTLMAAARLGVKTFVYPSSGSIYGAAARDVPLIDEDALQPAPVALYGLTKRAAETLLPRTAATQNVSFAAARLGSVYGPWEYATGVRDTLSPTLSCWVSTRPPDERPPSNACTAAPTLRSGDVSFHDRLERIDSNSARMRFSCRRTAIVSRS
jgi:nucleoside-diphosphate-sugar epimerase